MSHRRGSLNLTSSVLAATDIASQLYNRLWAGGGEVDANFTIDTDEPKRREGNVCSRLVTVHIHCGKVLTHTVTVWLFGDNLVNGVLRWNRADVAGRNWSSHLSGRTFKASFNLDEGRWVINGLDSLITMREVIAPAVQEALGLPRPWLPR